MELLEKCSSYPNFIISSGCDIPPLSSWDNIQAFFNQVEICIKTNKTFACKRKGTVLQMQSQFLFLYIRKYEKEI